MTYADMLSRYATDKADLRYGDRMPVADLGPALAGTGFNAFAKALSGAGAVKGFATSWDGEPSRKDLKDLETFVRGRGAGGLAWFRATADGGLDGPIAKFLSGEEIGAIRSATGAADGDVVFVVADETGRVHSALDGLRRTMAARLGLAGQGWAFCWLVEPPLFEWSDDEGKWVSAHHPFTSPAGDDLDPTTATSRGYDLVLNGYEIGGGSIRIHRPDVQHRVFEILGLSDEQIREQFGHLLTAFGFGVPPHGGIAMGIDRLVMLMAGKDTIRDVTAFPKAQSGADPLTGAPAPAAADQLEELGIAVLEREEEGS
jgi:aspartyl-tRNA synthetase